MRPCLQKTTPKNNTANIKATKESKKQNLNINLLSQPVQTVKVGRNDPCPCGSGKKYKKCCLS